MLVFSAQKKAEKAASQKNLQRIAEAQKQARKAKSAPQPEVAGADKMSKQKRLELAAAGRLQKQPKAKNKATSSGFMGF